MGGGVDLPSRTHFWIFQSDSGVEIFDCRSKIWTRHHLQSCCHAVYCPEMTQGGHWHHLYTTDFWNFWLRSQKFKKCCISLIKSVWSPKMPFFDFAFFRTFWVKKSIFWWKIFLRPKKSIWGSKIIFPDFGFFRSFGPEKSKSVFFRPLNCPPFEKNFKFAQFWSFWAENFRICF